MAKRPPTPPRRRNPMVASPGRTRKESRQRDDDERPAVAENPFIVQATKNWKQANEAETDNRREHLEDLKFLDLDQWPAEIAALRSERGRERPMLTLDQIGEPYRQLVSNQQQADAAIAIIPESGPGDIEEADFYKGLIRSIEYESNARTHYSTAFQGSVGGGLGYVRVRSEFVNARSMDQRIVIEAPENPLCVFIDPTAQQPDRSDMRYAFITHDLPWEEFKRQFPKSQMAKFTGTPPGGKGRAAGLSSWDAVGDDAKDWFPDGNVRIAEVYELKYHDKTLVLGSDGQTYLEGDPMPEGVTPTADTRPTQIPYVTWCKINAIEILEGDTDKDGNVVQTGGRQIPGTTIPIRPCYGQVINVNGKRTYRGIVRAARDPQRMYNYQNSALTEELALAPKAKVMMAEGQDEGFEEQWDQANIRNFSVLKYKPTTLAGMPVAPPGAPPSVDPAKIQAIVLSVGQSKQDIRTTTGWYDTTDANRRNSDQSGKAIQARKNAQDQSGLTYYENFRAMLISVGKLVLDWIPEIYDREGRVVRVMGSEDKPNWAMIGEQGFTRDKSGMPKAADAMTPPEAKRFKFNPQSGAVYGVRVTIGASHATRREEAAQTLGGLISAHPPMMGVFGDLWIKNLDIPDSEEIAERVRRTIPPNILGEDGMEDVPPQVQAKLAQADQMIQAMQRKLQEQQQIIETKQIEIQGKAATDSQKLQGEMIMERLKNENEMAIAQLKGQITIVQEHVKLLLAQQQIDATRAQANIEQQSAEMDRMVDLGQLAGDGSEAQRIPSRPEGSGLRP